MIIKGRLSTERTDKNIRVLFFFPVRLNNPGKSRGYRFRLCSMFLLNLYIKLQPWSKLLEQ